MNPEVWQSCIGKDTGEGGSQRFRESRIKIGLSAGSAKKGKLKHAGQDGYCRIFGSEEVG